MFSVSEADNDFKKCCDMGTNWASEGLECSKFSGPVPGIPKLQQTICMKAVDLCCLRSHRDKMCEEGKNDARNSANCAEVNSNNVGDSEGHRKACCEGCQLGISIKLHQFLIKMNLLFYRIIVQEYRWLKIRTAVYLSPLGNH